MQLLVKRILILNLIKKIGAKGDAFQGSHSELRVLDLGFFSHKKKKRNYLNRGRNYHQQEKIGEGKKFGSFLDLFVSSLCRDHANLLCIVPILSDVSEETL